MQVALCSLCTIDSLLVTNLSLQHVILGSDLIIKTSGLEYIQRTILHCGVMFCQLPSLPQAVSSPLPPPVSAMYTDVLHWVLHSLCRNEHLTSAPSDRCRRVSFSVVLLTSPTVANTSVALTNGEALYSIQYISAFIQQKPSLSPLLFLCDRSSLHLTCLPNHHWLQICAWRDLLIPLPTFCASFKFSLNCAN